jgi:RNA methyltransferase, TrmH family
MITSLQNDKVKLANALQTHARSRRKERKIALEGPRLVRDALERGYKPDFVLYTPETADAELVALLEKHSANPTPVTDEVMRHVSDTQQPQGIVGVFPLPYPALPKTPHRVLILDVVRDPGNLGTILRTAAAAGTQVVLLSPGCTDPYNPKVLRGGMGAHFRVPVIEAKWDEIANYCEPLNVYIADSHSDKPYSEVDWSADWALIIGSEAHGTSSDAAAMSQTRIFIPMAAQTESLNAAVAAGVILFEAHRQRMQR